MIILLFLLIILLEETQKEIVCIAAHINQTCC